MPKLIYLRPNKIVIIDDEDYERVSEYKWSALVGKYTYYAIRSYINEKGISTTMRMHRFILNLKEGDLQVDHRNHHGWDNRKQNLRLATPAQNQQNARKTTNKTNFKYKGVFTTDQIIHKWTARIYVEGKQISLGHFKTELEAVKVYNAAALKYFGEFAFLNKIN